ncbi:hypothetical protein [Streptomyces sp. WAC06614]|uniref:hypothetical protein n=1 Tax=Streptomyces sp. WAC06614 TaxID=2487416 RepID=UPI00163C1F9B|nr:hypothetical protein [Streptomyces sp. WAC06614]
MDGTRGEAARQEPDRPSAAARVRLDGVDWLAGWDEAAHEPATTTPEEAVKPTGPAPTAHPAHPDTAPRTPTRGATPPRDEPPPATAPDPGAATDLGTPATAADPATAQAAAPATAPDATAAPSAAPAVAAGDGTGSVQPSEEAEQPEGRVPRPVIIAAATAGALLIGLPLVLAPLSHGSAPDGGPHPAAAAGYTREGETGDAFVPGADPRDTATPAAPGAAGAPAQGPGPVPQTGPAGDGAPHGPAPAPGPGGDKGGGTPSRPDPEKPPQPAPAPTFTAVAGRGCGAAGTGYRQRGWFERGNEGWLSRSEGGWTGDGCTGMYTAVPMSGEAAKDDGNSVLWTFETGRVATGSCRISVYVPGARDVVSVGGNPTHYTVQNQFDPGSGTIGSFSVPQVSRRGQWVDGGTFPLSRGRIAVLLHTRGQDWSGSTKTYAHHAASAVRAHCTGS